MFFCKEILAENSTFIQTILLQQKFALSFLTVKIKSARLTTFMTKTFNKVSFLKFGISSVMISALILLAGVLFLTPVARAAEVIQTWWPTSGAHISGTQPFKAVVSGLDVSRYEMFWQVDGGQWNWMDSNYTDYQHKEASVNVSGWTWRGSGPYVINFIARQNGVILAQYPVTVYVDSGLPTVSVPKTTTTTVAPAPTSVISATVTTATATATTAVSTSTSTISPTVTAASGNPLAGLTFYVDPNSRAAQQAQEWQYSNPAGASMMRTLAARPTAVWLGEWNTNVTKDVQSLMAKAKVTGSVPAFVLYAIPQRDCGGYSSGGTNNPSAYTSWVKEVALGIGSGKAVVVLEPDALSQISCLSATDQKTRLSLISSAVTTLKKNSGTKVYIDAGHSGWISAVTMSSRLKQANVASAEGFALNSSNFMSTGDEIAYGTSLSALTNNKHFVIDTSRNGNGSNGAWCNPSGRAIGQRPTTATGNALLDAFLWIKVPGESDGTCNGGPSAGMWWPSYAVALVQNAPLAFIK